MYDEKAALAAMPAAIALPSGATLRRWRPADRDILTSTLNANHAYLRAWMPWAAQPATDESSTAYINRATAEFDSGIEFGYGLFAPDGELLGSGGVHNHGPADRVAIGYWIAESHSGKGLGREVAQALTAVLAAVPSIDHVEIHCDEANVRSAAIARALGYQLMRIESREPVAPAETGRFMIWSLDLSPTV